MPCASGSNWASKPALGHDRGAIKSLGWKWDKTRRTDPARISRHWLVLAVATLLTLAYGTRACPRPRPGGGRRLRPQDRPRQPAHTTQGASSHTSQPLAPDGPYRKRNPARHRLAQAAAPPGPTLEPRLAAARTLATTQAQPGGHPPSAFLKTPYIPLSDQAGVLPPGASAGPERPDRLHTR